MADDIIVYCMSLLKTASLAIVFGSLYTIFRKYQTIIELPSNQTSHFNQPILQSFIIFVGMCTIVLFRPWMNQKPTKNEFKPADNKYIYFMPSLLDVLGTVVDTTGLYYTSVSVSQMLKGSVLFFTYLISLFYLKRTLSFQKHIYMSIVLVSLVIIGCSNLEQQPNKYEQNPLLGNILIIISQLLFSLMFIYEEKILNKYDVKVSNAVFWQGIWGVLIAGLVLFLFSVFRTPIQSKVVESCILICSNYDLLLAVLLTALCIGPFNYFGITLTKMGSALQRCMICTSRMIVVWSISLAFGWQQFHMIQLLGYVFLTWAIYKFSNCDNLQPQNAQLTVQQELALHSQEIEEI